jgi:hypothetical protein
MGLANRRINPRRATNALGARQAIENAARQLANRILEERALAARRARNGRTYTPFNAEDDILPNNVETITKGLFTGNTGSLLNFHTSSTATATQNTYYRQIYNEPSTNVTSQPQFSIAYGDFNGSGSKDLTGNLNNDTPSRAIYKQYAQILLDPLDKKFTIDGNDTDRIYVLNFNRARFREKIDPGNIEINLAHLSGSEFLAGGGSNATHTGSNVTTADGITSPVLRLIDDSSTANAAVGESGRIYNIVSGTIDEGTVIHNPSAPLYFGLLYPEAGIVVLDADRLDLSASFATVTGSGVQGDNAMKMFTSLSGSGAVSAGSGDNYGLQARSSEQLKSTYYFVRIKNGDYNYSNNPSFVTGSNGDLSFTTFINDPQTFITTIGMYNERRELLAVAKMSQPILKSFTREVLIKVKLDF